MTTNISIVDDYTMSLVKSQPVAAFFTLPATVPAPTAAPVVEPVEEQDEADVEAKVVNAPSRRKAAPKTTDGAETK